MVFDYLFIIVLVYLSDWLSVCLSDLLSDRLVCLHENFILFFFILAHLLIDNCEEDLPEKPVGQLSAVCWPTVSRLLVDCQPVCWSTVSPSVGRLLANRQPTGFALNRPVSRRGALLHNYLLIDM